MPKTLSIAAAFGLTLALAAPAAAQDRPDDLAPDVSYDFEDENVEGTYDSPLGTLITSGGDRRHTSLIRPRVHFIPEMLKSVERL